MPPTTACECQHHNATIQLQYLVVLGTPDLAVNVLDWQLQTDNLVTHQQLHASVVFKQRHQITV